VLGIRDAKISEDDVRVQQDVRVDLERAQKLVVHWREAASVVRQRLYRFVSRSEDVQPRYMLTHMGVETKEPSPAMHGTINREIVFL